MGHADVKTTEIYTHVMEKDISAAASPLTACAMGIPDSQLSCNNLICKAFFYE
jgi:hypothetical protein